MQHVIVKPDCPETTVVITLTLPELSDLQKAVKFAQDRDTSVPYNTRSTVMRTWPQFLDIKGGKA